MFDKAFRKAPFMRVLIPLAGGIIMARHYSMPVIIIWILTGFLVLFLLLLFIISDRPSKPVLPLLGPRNGLLAAIFQGLFLCMGLMMGREDEIARIPETMLQARICDEILEGERTFKTRLDRIYYRSGEKWICLDGRVQVYLEREDRCRELVPGDCISASGRLLRYEDPVNPFEFNYGAYQRGKGVSYHLYLDSSSWVPCPAYAARGLQIRSKLIRRTLMEQINRNIEGSDERAILYSLLLGYRAELGQDVKQQFVRSGSMHILAVSGLHVGILYILPAFLIGKIRGSVTGRLLATLALLALLWSYALLTGLSPSVVRAVSMCSVHRMALLMGRRTGIFHVLSLTAFVMVLSRPGIIFETGFQLSFAAVAGIAGFQKPLSMMIPTKGWLARRTWQLVTVSLAAQLATAPLSLFYFHQFSNVFILSNLAVIPLVTVILYVGLAFILLSSLGLYPLSGVLEWLTSLLDWITLLMGRIPGAFNENITLIPVQVFLLYLAIILTGLFFRSRKALLLHAMLLTVALLLLVSGIREYRVRSHEKFYVFSIPRESAISFVRGKNHSIYRGGRVRGDTLQVPFALRNFGARHKLSSPVFLQGPVSGAQGTIPGRPGRTGIEYYSIDTGGVQLLFTVFRDCRIMILRRLTGYLPEEGLALETDILVLVDNVSCNLDSLIHVFKPGMIIVDGSNHSRYHTEMEKACIHHGILFHSTEKDGFYVY
jgi:competence protein ComEC